MLVVRSIIVVAALFGTGGLLPAKAQEPDQGPAERKIQFTGTIRQVNASVRKVEVNALGIPTTPNASVPVTYTVPDSVDISKFHSGDQVEGELVVRDNRTRVESLRVIGTEEKAKAPKDSASAFRDTGQATSRFIA